MAWSSDLQTEILEQFADPRWSGMALETAHLPTGVETAAQTINCRVVSRKPDDELRRELFEMAATRICWTAKELANATGLTGRSGAILCGQALQALGWTRRLRSGYDAAVWVNHQAVLARCDGKTDLRTTEMQEEIGLPATVIANVLKDAGWTLRRKMYWRVWNPPVVTQNAA